MAIQASPGWITSRARNDVGTICPAFPYSKGTHYLETLEQIAYVNGSFVPLSEAKVSILDRGFLFADGIYEVAAVLDGKLIDNASHLARLERSVGEIELALAGNDGAHPGDPAGADQAQQSRQRHGLPGSDARRRHRPRLCVSQGRQADAGHVYVHKGHHQRAVGQDRHQGDHGARPALDPARHQERRAAWHRCWPSRLRLRPAQARPG